MPIGMIQPKFQALADDIRTKIESGELKPGDKLPGIHTIKKIAECSDYTVKCALLILKTEGYLVGRNGIGVFVAGDDQ